MTTNRDPELGEAMREKSNVFAQHNGEAGVNSTNQPSDDTIEDTDIVDWAGTTDPEHPLNWPDTKKWMNIAVLSSLSVVTSVHALIQAHPPARRSISC